VRPLDWKTIAWNGVRFAVRAIGSRAGSEGGISCSSLSRAGDGDQMGRGQGRFSRRRQLRELSRRIGRKRSTFQERSLPGVWRTSLSGFEAAGFQWDAENERAMGVLLYCAACRTASLIQFFDRPGTANIERNAARVLGSFRDHGTDQRVAWALYDIVAFLPDYFTLERHRFETGRFVLEFKGGVAG